MYLALLQLLRSVNSSHRDAALWQVYKSGRRSTEARLRMYAKTALQVCVMPALCHLCGGVSLVMLQFRRHCQASLPLQLQS